jgi:hypothetical protein
MRAIPALDHPLARLFGGQMKICFGNGEKLDMQQKEAFIAWLKSVDQIKFEISEPANANKVILVAHVALNLIGSSTEIRDANPTS